MKLSNPEFVVSDSPTHVSDLDDTMCMRMGFDVNTMTAMISIIMAGSFRQYTGEIDQLRFGYVFIMEYVLVYKPTLALPAMATASIREILPQRQMKNNKTSEIF